MSNEQKTNVAVDKMMALVVKIGKSLWSLKQSNPKFFFGGIAGVAVTVFLIVMSEESGEIAQPKIKELTPGHAYTLKNPNSVGDNATTELVAVPGNTAAFDVSEDNDSIVCKAPNGTRVRLKNFADAFGKHNLFAEVEVQSGPCAGKIGWTLVVNIDEGT